MPRLTVVISQGQSASPQKRKLEEDLVAALLMAGGCDVTVVPHLYDLSPDSTGMLCLQGIAGDMVLLSWLYPRAAHWTLDRQGIKGRMGTTLLRSQDEDEGEEEQEQEKDGRPRGESDDPADSASNGQQRVGGRNFPNRTIYHLDLRWRDDAQAYVDEIKRIVSESAVQTLSVLGLFPSAGSNGKSAPAGAAAGAFDVAALVPAGGPIRIEETPARRWYPVIDYSRCTNCMECIDFCLFGVYGVDRAETILVEQPDNCRKGCPACSRVCPENAIIFPQHKTPAIAGSPDGEAGGLKIDLSQLFGAPNAVELAAKERDVELVAVGRDAVGLSVGIPKRQEGKALAPKDDLDSLIDQLDELGL